MNAKAAREQLARMMDRAIGVIPQSGIKHRGFASFDRAKLLTCARKGGQHAHELGKAHEWTPAEAQAAGRKGGRTRQANKAARMAQETIELRLAPYASSKG